MISARILAFLLVCTSSLVLGQTVTPAGPSQGNSNQENTGSAVSQAQGAAASNSAIPDSTKLELVKSPKTVYPLAASKEGIQGQVWLRMVVSETGDVENVSVISGDPVLAKAALEAGKQWKFKPFIKNGVPIKVPIRVPFDFYFGQKLMKNGVSEDRAAVSASSTTVSGPDSKLDPASLPKRVRVSQGVSQGLLIHQIAPIYPETARQMRVEGTVLLQAIIGTDGRVQNIKAVSGHSMLVPAAIGAVEQWRYRPYLLEGKPVEVDTQITVNFQLR